MAEIIYVTMSMNRLYYAAHYPIGEKLPTLDSVIRTRVALDGGTRYKYVSRTVVEVDVERRTALIKLNRKKGQELSSREWLRKSREVAE